MQLEDIKKLADLSRMEIDEEEMKGLIHDFDSILAYVGQVQEVSDAIETKPRYVLTNVMRDDVVTNKPFMYTEKIVALMPESKDGFLKVKQIL